MHVQVHARLMAFVCVYEKVYVCVRVYVLRGCVGADLCKPVYVCAFIPYI